MKIHGHFCTFLSENAKFRSFNGTHTNQEVKIIFTVVFLWIVDPIRRRFFAESVQDAKL